MAKTPEPYELRAAREATTRPKFGDPAQIEARRVIAKYFEATCTRCHGKSADCDHCAGTGREWRKRQPPAPKG